MNAADPPAESLHFPHAQAWREWLTHSHATQSEAWVVHVKKHCRLPGLRYQEAVEEALCFGWIDSKLRSVNADVFVQRYSPRRPGGIWSPSNRARAERLMAEGRMAPAGVAAVERAKHDGSWDAAYEQALQRSQKVRRQG